MDVCHPKQYSLHQSSECVCISPGYRSNPYLKHKTYAFCLLRLFLFYHFLGHPFTALFFFCESHCIYAIISYFIDAKCFLVVFVFLCYTSLPFNPFVDIIFTDINVEHSLLVTKLFGNVFISFFNGLPIELMSATFFKLI